MGTDLFDGEVLRLSTPEFEHIFSAIFEPAVRGGGYAIYDGYSSDLSKTGDIVCSTGSTAGILFYGEEITYPDNTKERVDYSVLPYPTFAGGKKNCHPARERLDGGQIYPPGKEEAAAVFLKWFTRPEQNMCFVASTGYLPVTHQAFAQHMEREIAENENPNIRKLLRTAIYTHGGEYDFYIPPVFDRFNVVSKDFERDFLAAAMRGGANDI